MAAVRCAARRLGGYLLQRTQAEERRRLVPSRLMRSRDLSSEQAREIQQKKEALYDAVSNAELRKRELHDALTKAGQEHTANQHLSVKGTKQQQPQPQPPSLEHFLMYGRLAKSVLGFATQMTFFVALTVAMVNVTKYNAALKSSESSEEKVES